MLDVENGTPSTSTCLPCRSKSFPKMNIQFWPNSQQNKELSWTLNFDGRFAELLQQSAHLQISPHEMTCKWFKASQLGEFPLVVGRLILGGANLAMKISGPNIHPMLAWNQKKGWEEDLPLRRKKRSGSQVSFRGSNDWRRWTHLVSILQTPGRI